MTITQALPRPAGRARAVFVDLFEKGLDAPICLTWEPPTPLQPVVRALPVIVGRGAADPRELSDGGVQAGIDDPGADVQVFYVDIGGGSQRCGPTSGLVEYADRAPTSA